VQLGAATEELNRSWYERNTGRHVTAVQRRIKHSAIPWMAATLDGIVEGTEAVFEAKFICRRHSPKILPPKSIWLRSSTTCGSHT
jgi:YqaJ-like viral recombinase domain